MKANKILLIVLLAFTVFSCKDESKKDAPEETTKTEEAVTNSIKITMNALVLKDDSFQVYYKDKDDQQEPYDEKRSIYTVFKGSPNPQDIVFTLPEDTFPNYFRFDFGINKEQSEVVINNIKFEYQGKSFVINNNELANYISFNEGTLKFNKEKGSVTPFVSKDGNYDPMSFTALGMHDKIQSLIK